jgi:hypothetical protein
MIDLMLGFAIKSIISICAFHVFSASSFSSSSYSADSAEDERAWEVNKLNLIRSGPLILSIHGVVRSLARAGY